MVKSLIGDGTDVNVRYDDGETPLHLAVNKGNAELALVLIEHGADLNAVNKQGETPLFLATKRGNRFFFISVLFCLSLEMIFKQIFKSKV